MFLLIDKPKGMTSHDVVNKLRRITGVRKIGHAGTLDHIATGLLIVGIGRESTKNLWKNNENQRKEYTAEIILGEERDSDDITGKVRITKNLTKPTRLLEDQVKKTLGKFQGQILQIPPQFSAVKLKGKKAYQIARKGGKLNLKTKKVVIYSIELQKYSYPKLKIKCVVSKGTYIRSLARDIGRSLEVGAYLSVLRRESIGGYSVSQAVDLEKLNSANWKKHALDAIMN